MTTISRALVTIKHNATTIFDETRGLQLAGVTRDGVEVTTGKSTKDYLAVGAKSLQSIKDKISAEFDLRSRINRANTETIVSFNGKDMSIQDALTYRTHILPKLVELRDRLMRDLANARSKYSDLERDYDSKARKVDNDAEYKKLIERKEKPTIIDTQDEIDGLNAEIKFFELEFDAILTEKNPTISI